jgi:hypothetical protein
MIAGKLRGRVLSRMLRGWVHTSRLLRAAAEERAVEAAPRRSRVSTLGGLTNQVAAFADEGASSSQIAQRTGLTHDAIALILHFRSSPRGALSTGRGTLYRAEPAASGWIVDA